MNWFCQNWLELLKALGPLIIGVIVAYIAYQQWKVNRATLREKLFDRRIKIYIDACNIHDQIIATHTVTDTTYFEFNSSVTSAYFLFPQRVYGLLEDYKAFAHDLRLRNALGKSVDTKVSEQAKRELDRINTEMRVLLSFDKI